MNEFLKFFDQQVESYPMHLDISYCKTCDWDIHVYKKGCDEHGDDLEILHVQDCDVDLCFAKAQVALKEWLREHRRGY